MNNIYLALVHHPIKNKNGDLVTTSVTNMDIHDISRSCKTFNISKYFLITPIEKQSELINKILDHWKTDNANNYNPDRHDAMSIIAIEKSLEEAMLKIKEETGKDPFVCATGANFQEFSGDENVLKQELKENDRPLLIIFGTGWGLHQNIYDKVDFKLNPIFGQNSEYNHLSVRSAVAIYLDRLFRKRDNAHL